MKSYALAGLAVATFGTAGVEAATITQYTFEGTGTTAPYTADTGTGSATVNAGTVTFPAGNGSAKALSANGFSVGSYFQFTASSTGFQDLSVSFDVNGSNTGPANFEFSYSTNGTTFTDFNAYTVANYAWNTTTFKPDSTRTFDLSAIDSLEDLSTVTFRLVDTSTTAIASASAVAASGTSRVDNFTVTGTATPEPASLGLLGLAGATLVSRRRRQL